MIDIDKEEFLARLDIRIATITSALAYHEKYLLAYYLPKKEFNEAERAINNMNARFNEYVKEMDEKIREHFGKIKEEIAKENCENKSCKYCKHFLEIPQKLSLGDLQQEYLRFCVISGFHEPIDDTWELEHLCFVRKESGNV